MRVYVQVRKTTAVHLERAGPKESVVMNTEGADSKLLKAWGIHPPTHSFYRALLLF